MVGIEQNENFCESLFDFDFYCNFHSGKWSTELISDVEQTENVSFSIVHFKILGTIQLPILNHLRYEAVAF